MTGLVGIAGTALALVSAVALVVLGWAGARGRSTAGLVRTAARALLLGGTASMGALVTALLRDDFSLRYVAETHARATPFPYDVATAWAALEGSIVLWLLVLVGCTWLVARRVGPGDRLGLGAVAVLGGVCLFFAGLVLTAANPFGQVVPVPVDGPGPNPLLQNNPLMAVHPPLLYLGYVGLSVPFAFGMSALALGDAGRAWLERTRRWTIGAWVLLTAGIAVGAVWSYEVLGWGGYWAWDPVENASLLPWLTATAFLHSAIAQARRDVLRAWNVALLIATYSLTILGTFLTRSGVVASVHSFSQSAVGPILLGFFVVVLTGSLGLLARRGHLVTSGRRIDRVVSREGMFLVNNLLLSLLTFVVVLGTTYPIVLEAVTGSQVSVGRPFFDRFAIPLAWVLLAAAAAGPLLPYRAVSRAVVLRRLTPPVLAGLATGAVLVVSGVRTTSVVVTTMLAVVVLGAVVVDLTGRTADVPGGRVRAVARVVRANLPWWGGQLAHVGLAVAAVGVATTGALTTVGEATFAPGEQAEVAGVTLRYDGRETVEEPHRTSQVARLELVDDDGASTALGPRLNLYTNSTQPVATPAVDRGVTRDVYVSLRRLEEDEASVEVLHRPLQWMVWAGLALVVTGGTVAAVGRRASRRRPAAVRGTARAATARSRTDQPAGQQ
jgi:cytochrome c-type biogenesis protein CcmF